MQRLRDAFHIYLRHLAQGHGWEVDRVSDFARLVRVPGTINHKPEKSCPSVPVTLLEHHPEARYAPAALATFLRACGEQFDPDREAAPEDARFPSDTTPGTEAAGQYWLDRYMAKVKAEQDGRRRYGFALACQLRDAHLSLSAAEPFMRRYQAEFKVQHGKGHYTWAEAERTLKSAYSRDPRAKAQGQAASGGLGDLTPPGALNVQWPLPVLLDRTLVELHKANAPESAKARGESPRLYVRDGRITETRLVERINRLKEKWTQPVLADIPAINLRVTMERQLRFVVPRLDDAHNIVGFIPTNAPSDLVAALTAPRTSLVKPRGVSCGQRSLGAGGHMATTCASDMCASS